MNYSVLAIVSLSLVSVGGSARAVVGHDAVLSMLTPGTSLRDARGLLAKGTFEEIRWLRREDPKALADGLVRTRLLETLNQMRLTPIERDSGGLDPNAFRDIVILKSGGVRHVLVFGDTPDPRGRVAGREGGEGESILRFSFVRMPVAVDTSRDKGSGSSPDRLHRLRDALAELERGGHRLRPVSRDRYGNVLAWRADGKVSIAASYVPELDELRVVAFFVSG